MDFISPRRKEGCRLPKPKPLPLIPKENGEFYTFTGVFDGFSVIISDIDEMKKIISMGYFGKATLSRSFPQFDGNWDRPAVIRNRQFRARKRTSEKYKIRNTRRKIIVVPDSADEEYFTNLQAHYEVDECGNKETVSLMLEEAFFLHDALECLNVIYDNRLIESFKVWDLFKETSSSFSVQYAVYYHFRCRNWVVKPGTKFGGHFCKLFRICIIIAISDIPVLYKEGPPFYHASYVVLIQNEFEKIKTTVLSSLQRMCETSGKELLICQISIPDNEISPKTLHQVKIKEILMKRWIPSQERQVE